LGESYLSDALEQGSGPAAQFFGDCRPIRPAAGKTPENPAGLEKIF
jgi:hypothetical protein